MHPLEKVSCVVAAIMAGAGAYMIINAQIGTGLLAIGGGLLVLIRTLMARAHEQGAMWAIENIKAGGVETAHHFRTD